MRPRRAAMLGLHGRGCAATASCPSRPGMRTSISTHVEAGDLALQAGAEQIHRLQAVARPGDARAVALQQRVAQQRVDLVVLRQQHVAARACAGAPARGAGPRGRLRPRRVGPRPGALGQRVLAHRLDEVAVEARPPPARRRRAARRATAGRCGAARRPRRAAAGDGARLGLADARRRRSTMSGARPRPARAARRRRPRRSDRDARPRRAGRRGRSTRTAQRETSSTSRPASVGRPRALRVLLRHGRQADGRSGTASPRRGALSTRELAAHARRRAGARWRGRAPCPRAGARPSRRPARTPRRCRPAGRRGCRCRCRSRRRRCCRPRAQHGDADAAASR